MITARLIAGVGLALALAGCTAPNGKTYPGSIEGNLPTAGTMIPETNFQVGPHISFTLEKLAVAGVGLLAIKVVYDPLAPNWEVQQAPLDANTYYVKLQAKRFRIGGDGEAMMVMKRRAVQLQRAGGYDSYRILDYAEGIESNTPIAQKYSEGIIQLVKVDPLKAAAR